MATGPDHYKMAESLLKVADEGSVDWEPTVATAQVHALLSLAAATALGHLIEGGPMGADRKAWIAAASEHPGEQRRISEANARFEEAQR